MKILGYDYEVRISGDYDEIDAYGRLHTNKQMIQIAANLTTQQTESAILHEIIEAINSHLELGMEHKNIMALEAVLYQVLTDAGIDLRGLDE